ncbi:hypothetical protein K438DRAFT_1820650 [Mycena galopus ATCC 62051]|nr:hypothetical protein K438DRAFT_1820650 [Mycena galopus ATCC 62051]
MHSTTATVPAVQSTVVATTSTTDTRETIEARPVNQSNGPTCAHCSWRGGGHAPNCPFR